MTPRNRADGLAALVTGPDFAEAVEQRHDHIAHVLLATLAVCADDAVRPGLTALSESVCGRIIGPVALFDSRLGGPAVAAAISIGMAAHGTLLAERLRGAGGHPATHAVSAIVASAEAIGFLGCLLRQTLPAGHELSIQARVALMVPRASLSPNSLSAMLGAGAGGAYLLTLGAPDRVVQAIGAAAVSLQRPVMFSHNGTESYRVVGGIEAVAVLDMGIVAAAGWGAPAGTFAHLFAGQSEDPGLVGAEFNGITAISANYYKRLGTCVHCQLAFDAVCALGADWEGDSDRDEVKAVGVRCGSQAAGMLSPDLAYPCFAARYSIRRLAAVACWYCPDSLPALDDDRRPRPEVGAMATWTSVPYDTSLADAASIGRPTSNPHLLRDGRRFGERIGQVPRREAQDPLSQAEFRRAARPLLERAHGPEWAIGVVDTVDNFEKIGADGPTKTLHNCSSATRSEAIATFTPERIPVQ